jgi:hypothetical protein
MMAVSIEGQEILKSEIILTRGSFDALGIVFSGCVQVIDDDIYGNRTI